MTKYFTSLLLAIVLFSCKNKFDGKIEERYGSYYLVNTSPSQSFRFTIKETELEDSSVHNYTTELIELAPGAEKFLGKVNVEEQDNDFSLGIDTSLNDLSIEIFQPTEEQIEEIRNRKKKEEEHKPSSYNFSEAFRESFKNEFDTIINGRLMMYRYVHKSISEKQTLPVHKFHYSFEIRGQVKLKVQ